MDPATIQRILARQGAQDTPENVNAIIQAAASDPSILERYSMGTAAPTVQNGRDIAGASGMDDNSALLQLQKSIGNSIASTDLPTSNGAPAPPPAAPVQAPARRAVPATGSRQGGYGPGASPSRQSGYGAGPSPDNATVGYEPSTGAPMPVPSGIPGGGQGEAGGLGGLEWLTALLGLRAVQKPQLPPPFTGAPSGGQVAPFQGPEAQYVGPMKRDDPRFGGYLPKNGQPGTPPGPSAVTGSAPAIDGVQANPKLQGGNPETYPGGAKTLDPKAVQQAPGKLQDPADVARMQAEVDAENAQAKSLQEQIGRQQSAQKSTKDTLNAAAKSQRGRVIKGR